MRARPVEVGRTVVEATDGEAEFEKDAGVVVLGATVVVEVVVDP